MNKKLIPPLVIAVIFVLYFIAIALGVAISEPLGIFTILGLGVLSYLIVTMIIVTIDRINEIKKGEDDDLSKY